MRTTDLHGNTIELEFIRLATKMERPGGIARRCGYNTCADKPGYEKVYMPYGEQGAGYYYSCVITP